MFLVDVNVLVAAFRDDHPQHRVAWQWLDEVTQREEPFTVPATVWASFLRLVTHRRVFPIPAPVDEAFTFVRDVVGQPGHLTLGPGPRHLVLLERVCRESGASGDLLADAVLATIAIEHSCTVATFDRDFARFSEVKHHLLRG